MEIIYVRKDIFSWMTMLSEILINHLMRLAILRLWVNLVHTIFKKILPNEGSWKWRRTITEASGATMMIWKYIEFFDIFLPCVACIEYIYHCVNMDQRCRLQNWRSDTPLDYTEMNTKQFGIKWEKPLKKQTNSNWKYLESGKIK